MVNSPFLSPRPNEARGARGNAASVRRFRQSLKISLGFGETSSAAAAF
jgi:hypothetical protein